MILAIVGTSINLTDNEERDIRQFIATSIKLFSKDTKIISGGAKGVDTIAIEVAKGLGYETEEILPTQQTWTEFRLRNIRITDMCNELYCFSVPTHKIACYHHLTVQDHEKTAGCWTLSKVQDLGKPTRLFVTPKR